MKTEQIQKAVKHMQMWGIKPENIDAHATQIAEAAGVSESELLQGTAALQSAVSDAEERAARQRQNLFRRGRTRRDVPKVGRVSTDLMRQVRRGRQAPVPQTPISNVDNTPGPSAPPPDQPAPIVIPDAIAQPVLDAEAIASRTAGQANMADASRAPDAYFEAAGARITNPTAFATQRYGDTLGPAMLGDLDTIRRTVAGEGPRPDDTAPDAGAFGALLADPALMSPSHRPGFVAYVQENAGTLAGQSPAEVRAAYRATKAPVTRYRALKVTDDVHAHIMQHGMDSKALRTHTAGQALVDPTELHDKPIATVLQNHIKPNSRPITGFGRNTGGMRTAPEGSGPFILDALRAHPGVIANLSEPGKDRLRELSASPSDEEVRTMYRAMCAFGPDNTELARVSSAASDAFRAARLARSRATKKDDAVLSVSEDRRVACAVAGTPEMAGTAPDGARVRLYTLQQNPLDLINPEDYLGTGDMPDTIQFDDDQPMPYTAAVESITLPRIPASAIQESEVLDAGPRMTLGWALPESVDNS